MSGSIKLFSFIRKYCHVWGIYLDQANENGQLTLNSRNRLCVVSFVIHSLSSGAFFIYEANSLFEYGLSFFAASFGITFLFIYLAMLWQMENILEFIENCEQFIEKSE